MSGLVSINLCCYNSEKYLRETLDSILNQTYTNWELIVINDGSKDSTESIIVDYIREGYPITYRYQCNMGLGYARNEALKLSQGEYIAFIDHDDIWLPEKLEKQIPLFKKDDRIGIVASNAIKFDNYGKKALFSKGKWGRGHVFKEFLGYYDLCLSSVVIRKAVLNEMNEYFDSRFRHIEDAEFFTRLAYRWHFDYVEEVLVKLRIHAESSTVLRPDLSPKETEQMVEKLILLYPEIVESCKDEIERLRFYIQYYYSLSDWKAGRNYMVRKRLRQYVFKNARAIYPFLFSYLPYDIYEILLLIYRKLVRKIPV